MSNEKTINNTISKINELGYDLGDFGIDQLIADLVDIAKGIKHDKPQQWRIDSLVSAKVDDAIYNFLDKNELI